MTSNTCARILWTNTFTSSLVMDALRTIGVDSFLLDDSCATADGKTRPLIQWCAYDALDHELTMQSPTSVLSSSFVIRKALIRKHYLHQTFVNYLAKHPKSLLFQSVPKTWNLDIAFSDELDELWGDELWDLAEKLDANSSKLEQNKLDSDIHMNASDVDWFILKPGMADRGMGIRLFRTRDDLQQIFEEFDDHSDEDEMDQEDNGHFTSVATSQLRHFVIQEYLKNPVLIDPLEASVTGENEGAGNRGQERAENGGRKFHLRVYCVASGALKLFISPNILALFAAVPYRNPSIDESDDIQTTLAPHLTNTCLQDSSDSENSVRLLSELVGCRILSSDDPNARLTAEDIDNIVGQVSDVLAESFQAALESPIHFQPLPNAFEIFGADLLITHNLESRGSSQFTVNILELNAEPAIEMTGARLKWILEDLFKSTAKVCVQPFVDRLCSESSGGRVNKDSGDKTGSWPAGETRFKLRKCLDVEVRSAASW
ncbi:hypothetical protein FRC02_006365 [Tulasnella sp. 418]|nr:hypothetical protein FRC02_006365 [Tulasnella sp. 418]